MIKFVIGLIALIFVVLTVYTYTDKKVEVVTRSTVTHDVVKKEVTETKVEKSVEVAKEVSTSVKSMVKQNKKISLEQTSYEEESENSSNKIGKGLTLESIKNADVSDEEKSHMLDDLANYRNSKERSSTNINLEEVVQIIEKDFEQGLIN